jgi:hypothetical protein
MYIKNYTYLLLFAGFNVLCAACGTTKKASGAVGNLKKKDAAVLVAALQQNQLAYSWFGAKAQVAIAQDGEVRNVTAKIRVRKDSLIWVSFAMFGIEGARAIITPDSVKILNRLEGTYIAESFAFFQKKYNAPLSFQNLQELIVGNVIEPNLDIYRATQDSTHYLLSKIIDGSGITYALDGKTLLLNSLTINDLRLQQNLTMLYADYQPLEKLPKVQAPVTRALTIRSAEKVIAAMGFEYNKIEIDLPMNVEFEIPNTYKQVMP